MTSSLPGINRVRNTSPVRPSIAAATTTRARRPRPTIALGQHLGLPHIQALPNKSLLGNPRDCVSETLAPQGQRTLTTGLDARPVGDPMGGPATRRPTARLVGRAWLSASWLTSLVERDSHTRMYERTFALG